MPDAFDPLTPAMTYYELWQEERAELERLRHPEPVHKVFEFACPRCGLPARLNIDLTPKETP